MRRAEERRQPCPPDHFQCLQACRKHTFSDRPFATCILGFSSGGQRRTGRRTCKAANYPCTLAARSVLAAVPAGPLPKPAVMWNRHILSQPVCCMHALHSAADESTHFQPDCLLRAFLESQQWMRAAVAAGVLVIDRIAKCRGAPGSRACRAASTNACSHALLRTHSQPACLLRAWFGFSIIKAAYPMPAVMHAQRFPARLSAACIIGSLQRMRAAGIPATGSDIGDRPCQPSHQSWSTNTQ